MAIPQYEGLLHPLLTFLSDGQTRAVAEHVEHLSDLLGLDPNERELRMPNSKQSVIAYRTAWARTYLKMSGLIEYPARGFARITAEGLKAIGTPNARVDLDYLSELPAYQEWRSKRRDPGSDEESATRPLADLPPLDRIDSAHREMRDALRTELLDLIRAVSPGYFEEIVVRLLVAMGYGGSIADAGSRLGRSGDGGIDGIIKEDRLGLDVVCIQAKRWEGVVGRPVVQSFVGSMELFRARKGVLLTTSSFSKEATDYVEKIESKKVVLIDGLTLADYMIDHNVGVSVSQTFVIKKIDGDFFDELGG